MLADGISTVDSSLLGDIMTENNLQTPWEFMSHEEKNHELYLKQKHLLETFLEKGAISKAQYDKSLHDLTEKMGYSQSDNL